VGGAGGSYRVRHLKRVRRCGAIVQYFFIFCIFFLIFAVMVLMFFLVSQLC
jgi:hypothetical protein